jgi:hypothetical protein
METNWEIIPKTPRMTAIHHVTTFGLLSLILSSFGYESDYFSPLENGEFKISVL